MKTKILINEIKRIQEIINISENKRLLKEGLSDDLVELISKFLFTFLSVLLLYFM